MDSYIDEDGVVHLAAPGHKQVPFATADGTETTVDEGIFDLLAMLKGFGVNTQFSCQGNPEAYVTADQFSFSPVLEVLLQSGFIYRLEFSNDEFGQRVTMRWAGDTTRDLIDVFSYYTEF